MNVGFLASTTEEPFPMLASFFRLWKKAQTTVIIVIECPKEDRQLLITYVNAGEVPNIRIA